MGKNKKKYAPILLDMVGYCDAIDKIEKGIPFGNIDHLKEKNVLCNLELLKRDDDLAICSIEPGRLVFCFQGSNDLKDWFNNFRFRKDKDNNLTEAGIHTGFYKTIMKFKKEVIAIASQYGNDKEIFFTGHSRGGALATLGAYLVNKSLGFPVSCITFGAPRVGGKAFRDVYRKCSIHLTECKIKRDPVPNLPFKAVGYKDIGYCKTLHNIGWYLLPIPGVGFRVHTDYYNNVKKFS